MSVSDGSACAGIADVVLRPRRGDFASTGSDAVGAAVARALVCLLDGDVARRAMAIFPTCLEEIRHDTESANAPIEELPKRSASLKLNGNRGASVNMGEIWGERASLSKFGRDLGLHVAVLQQPFIVGLEQHGADQPSLGTLPTRPARNRLLTSMLRSVEDFPSLRAPSPDTPAQTVPVEAPCPKEGST